MAAADYFLKIEGIKGESHNARHQDEIDVESFSWGATQVGTHGGGGAGKVTFNDFHFTMRINRASPTLFVDSASGLHIKQAVFVGETPAAVDRGGSQFLKYTFTDVIISSYRDAGASDVMDAAALRYTSVKTEATPGARIDVRPQATGNLMFDVATGRPTVVESQTGLLLSGPVVNVDDILVGLLRGVSEFALGDVLGLISGPSPHMRLVLGVQEARTADQPPTGTNLAAAATELVTTERSGDTPKKPKTKTLQHHVYWYAPADLALTVEDFDRKGQRLGRLQLDPDGEPLHRDFDLTEIAVEGHLASIGIRIQFALDHAGSGEDGENGDDNDDHRDEDENGDRPHAVKGAGAQATPRRPAAFMLTLQVVAD